MSAAIDWNVRPIPVRDEGLVGTLFLPATQPPYPVVITLGGSIPGIFTPPAIMLASQGIAALALAYFGIEHLPRELKRIPLEYVGRAIRWCRERKELRPEAVAVAGASRGGELALLVAAMFSELVAVVAWSPSGVMYGGMVKKNEDSVAAWCLGGQDLPFARLDRTAVNWNERPVRLTPGFVAGLLDEATVTAAEIPVERINGPVLLVSGTDDQVWPSSTLADIAVRRLRRYSHPFTVEHLCYEGAGHQIGPLIAPLGSTHFVHPVLGYDCEMGGTLELNVEASRDCWTRTVAFFNERFRNLPSRCG
jgi:dienelactone hydrolase